MRESLLTFLSYGAVVVAGALILALVLICAYLVTMLALHLLQDAEKYRERTKG